MVKQVVASMATPFAAIRGLPAFYRMLNKPVPTTASPYVESSLRPLAAFQEVLVETGTEESGKAWLMEMARSLVKTFLRGFLSFLRSMAPPMSSPYRRNSS